MCVPPSEPPPRRSSNIDTKNTLNFFKNEIDTLPFHTIEDAKKTLVVIDHILHKESSEFVLEDPLSSKAKALKDLYHNPTLEKVNRTALESLRINMKTLLQSTKEELSFLINEKEGIDSLTSQEQVSLDSFDKALQKVEFFGDVEASGLINFLQQDLMTVSEEDLPKFFKNKELITQIANLLVIFKQIPLTGPHGKAIQIKIQEILENKKQKAIDQLLVFASNIPSSCIELAVAGEWKRSKVKEVLDSFQQIVDMAKGTSQGPDKYGYVTLLKAHPKLLDEWVKAISQAKTLLFSYKILPSIPKRRMQYFLSSLEACYKSALLKDLSKEEAFSSALAKSLVKSILTLPDTKTFNEEEKFEKIREKLQQEHPNFIDPISFDYLTSDMYYLRLHNNKICERYSSSSLALLKMDKNGQYLDPTTRNWESPEPDLEGPEFIRNELLSSLYPELNETSSSDVHIKPHATALLAAQIAHETVLKEYKKNCQKFKDDKEAALETEAFAQKILLSHFSLLDQSLVYQEGSGFFLTSKQDVFRQKYPHNLAFERPSQALSSSALQELKKYVKNGKLISPDYSVQEAKQDLIAFMRQLNI